MPRSQHAYAHLEANRNRDAKILNAQVITVCHGMWCAIMCGIARKELMRVAVASLNVQVNSSVMIQGYVYPLGAYVIISMTEHWGMMRLSASYGYLSVLQIVHALYLAFPH